jgi:hypothetical protein
MWDGLTTQIVRWKPSQLEHTNLSAEDVALLVNQGLPSSFLHLSLGSRGRVHSINEWIGNHPDLDESEAWILGDLHEVPLALEGQGGALCLCNTKLVAWGVPRSEREVVVPTIHMLEAVLRVFHEVIGTHDAVTRGDFPSLVRANQASLRERLARVDARIVAEGSYLNEVLNDPE